MGASTCVLAQPLQWSIDAVANCTFPANALSRSETLSVQSDLYGNLPTAYLRHAVGQCFRLCGQFVASKAPHPLSLRTSPRMST